MAVRQITTRLALDGERQFKAAMTGVNASLRALKSELVLSEAQFKGQANTVAALTAKDKILRQEIEQQTVKVKALEQAVRDAAQVYGEDSHQVSNYQAQLNRARTELINMNGALEQNSRYLSEARHSADKTAGSLNEFGNETEQAGDSVTALASALQAAGLAMSLKVISDAIRACVDASMEFETAMANFNKVAKLSDTELAGMADAIKELSTDMPATTSEIAQVAEASRRLGISKEYVLEFSKVMLDLGNVSDLSSDQAATALARFANITGTAAEDYERLGSTIVALGNNFATSESEITNMASRLASAGKLAHLSESQIMGLAAAMSSVGIEAEAGGTAMTQTLTAMEKAVTSGGDKLDKFAEIAGMSSQEFARAWGEEPIAAIQAFIAGLGGLDEKGESATQVLEDLGLSGIRQSNMLKSLALASETLTSAVATANQAWIENTELAATAAAKYDTTQAKVQMAANAANNLKIAVGDQLTPALGVLANAGTGAFSWAADFVEQTPILVPAITGLVASLGALSVGLTAYSAKAALAALATTSFGAALAATPIGPVAVAIGALVGVFTAVTAAMEDTKSASEELLDSLEETKSRLAENTKAAEGTAEGLRAQADALLLLAGAGELNAAQQQALLNMTQELNAAVPGLNLAYDEQTGKLNMTADAVRNLIEAEARRMVADEGAKAYKELLVQQMEIARKLKAAEAELEQVRAASAAAMAKEAETGQVAIGVRSELEQKERELVQTVEELQEGFDEYQSGLDEVLDKYGDVASASDNATLSLEDLEKATKSLTEAQDTLTKAQDTLTKALKEQSEESSLSYKTAQDLIEAGYGAALAIDTESGAVTLNRDKYIELTNAKINDQIAALETQRAAILNTERLYQEAKAAAQAGSAYWEMAAAKLYAERTDTTAIDAQIAAMNRLRSTLGNVTGETTRASRASRSASRQAKTQAQQDLETYKQLKAELDHRKNMDLVDEAEYYRKMAEYRDQYLTDDANVSEYRKVTEQIYKYDKSLADQEAELWEEQSEKLLDELNDRVSSISKEHEKLADNISREQEKLGSKLGEYGGLYSMEKDKYSGKERMQLESLQKQIDAINAYDDALKQLRERGASSGLMDEVLGMDVDSATQYAKKLLSMSETQWDEYNSLWEEKQRRAIEVSEQYFKDQMDALDSEYNDRLKNTLDELTETIFAGGESTAQGLIDGMIQGLEKGSSKVSEMVREMALSAIREAQNTLGIHSPSTVFRDIGVNMAAGMDLGLKSQMDAIHRDIERMMDFSHVHIPSSAELAASFSTDRIREQSGGLTAQDLQNASAGIVNGMSTAMAARPSAPTKIVLEMDKREVGSILLDPMRALEQERPEIKNDN